MGELSRADAVTKRDSYVQVFESLKSYVETQFADMDFENADKRTEMYECIEKIQRDCDNRINELQGMTFE